MPELIEFREWRDLAFEDPEQELVFRFRVRLEDTGSNRQIVESVEPNAYLARRPNEIYRAPELGFNNKVNIYHVFQNGDVLEGWLEWQDRLVTEESQQVTSRISLQSALTHETWNYEGFMVQFGSKSRPLPPLPPEPSFRPVPDPFPDPATAVNIAQVDLNAQELFPFIYIQPWPDLPADLQAAAFITIPSSVTSSNSLWTKLAGYKSSGDAPDMRTEAVSFVDGGDKASASEPYSGEFVENVASLSPPYNCYLTIWYEIEQLREPDFEDLTRIVVKNYTSWAGFKADVATGNAVTDLQRIWNSLIALLIILGYRHGLFADLIRVVVVNHVLLAASAYADKPPKSPAAKKSKKKNPQGGHADADGKDVNAQSEPPIEPLLPSPALVKTWTEATVVAPGAIFPLPGKTTGAGTAADGNTWVRPYAIGSARSVHYDLQGYQLGEVQRIENILRGEVRERSNRNLVRSETSTDVMQSERTSDDRTDDYSSSDLVNQVQQTLSDHVTTTNIDNYTTSYGPSTQPDITASGNWWVQEQPAGGYLQDVSKFAKEVIEKTVRRISRQVHHRRGLMSFEETEVRDISRFDNLGGASDICGVYRWVTRTYRLRSRNLGDRLVLEIMLKDPAVYLLKTLQTYWQIDLNRPASPGVSSYKDILPEPQATPDDGVPRTASVYYLDLFEQFGVDDDLPPPLALVTIGQGFQSRNPVSEAHVDVPKGYVATAVRAQVTSYISDVDTEVFVGTTKLAKTGDDGADARFVANLATGTPVTSADGTRRLWISVLCKPKPASNTPPAQTANEPAPDTSPPQGSLEFTTYYLANVEIDCARSDQCLADWQYRAFRLVQAGYEAQLAAYQSSLDAQKAVIKAKNPDFLRDIVSNQIMQGCLSLLYAQYAQETKLAPTVIGMPNQMDVGEPRVFQYLRNALSWGDMNCQLFLNYDDQPARWMQEGQGGMLADLSPDLQFQNFLRADRARILVTARPDLVRSLLYFLGTGQIWPDADALVPCLEGDEVAVAKIKTEDRTVRDCDCNEDEWTIQVPTSMTVLSAIPLGFEGRDLE